MLDLKSVSIYIYAKERKPPSKKEDIVVRPDGMIECYETFKGSERLLRSDSDFTPIRYLTSVEIPAPDLDVSVHFGSYDPTVGHWEPFLVTLLEFFNQISPDIKKFFYDHHGCLNMDLGIYDEEPHMSAQDDMFIGKYLGWPYFIFDEKFPSIQSIIVFSDYLGEEFNLYDVYERDWEQTKIFIKDFTVINLNKTFNIIRKLREVNTYIFEKTVDLKNQLFIKNISSWKETLNKESP